MKLVAALTVAAAMGAPLGAFPPGPALAGPSALARSVAAAVAARSRAESAPAGHSRAQAAAAKTTPPGELVVGLRSGADPAAVAGRLADAAGVRVVEQRSVAGLRAVAVAVRPQDSAAAQAALRADPAVSYVEPDHRLHAVDVSANDPSRADQWGLDRTHVPAAWSVTTGSSAVTVAVVDTGVTAIPDLSGALLPGRDIVNNDADPADDFGHGTSTASIIAARGDNGIGIAGLCWACKILPVKVLDDQGSGSDSDVAAGIVWATDHGAQIINLSLGGVGESRVLDAAVAYAVGKGKLVLAAAGNQYYEDDDLTAKFYPAASPGALAVAASDSDGDRYSWSYHGSWVDVAAPGCNPALDHHNHLEPEFCGTSSATPFVAGLAALGLSANPSASAADLYAGLRLTATARSYVSAGEINASAFLSHVTAARLTGVQPTHYARVRGIFTATATTTDAVRVQMLIDGRPVATDTSAPFAPRWSSAGITGVSLLTVRAYDGDGQATVGSKFIVIDNTAPAVSMSGPANHKWVSGTVTVTATAGDAYGMSRVELLVGGRLVARDTAAPYRFSLSTRRYPRQIHVQVRAYDLAGNLRYAAGRYWYH